MIQPQSSATQKSPAAGRSNRHCKQENRASMIRTAYESISGRRGLPRRGLMPSFTTVYRAVVMFAVGAIVVTTWQHFGPSAEQVKSAVVSGIDMAETAWKNWQTPSKEERSKDPPMGSAPLFTQTPPAAATDPTPPPLATLNPANATGAPMNTTASRAIPANQEAVAPLNEKTAQPPGASDRRMSGLLSRLEQLGGAEPKLAPWGSSGHLYRFCCRAALADSPTYSRHFESVAEEPSQAVERVVAQVEAWRTERSNDTLLR
jgi:hypothetical protein